MALPVTMKAWQYTNTTGGLEKALFVNGSATPPNESSLKPSEILVRVVAASLNPVDYKIPEMPLATKTLISVPASPGLDYAGVVAALPKGKEEVGGLKVGDRVFGKLDRPTKFGTCAEYTVANLDGIAAIPDGVDNDSAASVGVAGLTSWQSISPYIGTNEGSANGKKVFINGGSGGTGVWGIQIARFLGAEVTVTCSARNVELVTNLGASEVIDYTKQDVVETLKSKGQVFDLVVDNIGTPADLYKASSSFLKPSGTYVQIGAASSVSSAVNLASRFLQPGFLGGGKRPFVFLHAKNNREHLAVLAGLLKEKKVKAAFDEVFEWEHVPKAFEKLKSGRASGKIVVHVSEQKE